MAKRTVRDIDVQGKRVLVRVDFNAPQDAQGSITDDTRLRAARPTLQYLRSHGARTVLMSHLGRPKGVDPKLTMAPIAARLSEILGQNVQMAPDSIGPRVEEMVKDLGIGQFLLLENLRFHPEEEKNDPAFAEALARLGDVYVDDAFGTAHRAHASTEGITHYLPAVAGLLMQRELEALDNVTQDPRHPFAAIIGGAKVSSKLGVLKHLLDKVDILVIGGGMACTFLKARGLAVGDSLLESELLPEAEALVKAAVDRDVTLLLPVDVVIADRFAADAATRTIPVQEIPSHWRIMDIGPESARLFESTLADCQTILWNGPMGVFEMPAFAAGTKAIADFMARSGAVTVVGGGDSVAALENLGVTGKITHVSTGGGATLEFLEGKTLPGVGVLEDRP